MDYGPVVFPASDFLRKNLGVVLRDCLYYFVYCFILILIAQKEKEPVLVNCDFAKLVSGCSCFLNINENTLQPSREK